MNDEHPFYQDKHGNVLIPATVANDMKVKDNGDGTWTIQMPVAMTIGQLENLADGIESGEVEGGFLLGFTKEEQAKLPDDILKRLGDFATIREPGSE